LQFTKKQKTLVSLAALAAVVVAVVVQLVGFTGATGSDRASGVISDFIIQDAGSTTVYQQQVNALWAVKDMLRVVADESANQARLQGSLIVLQVILIGLLALAIALFVRASESKEEEVAIAQSPVATEEQA
jgi:flagellar basal body-associated protein FliL